MKTATAIRHIAFEDLGYFAEPLRAAGYAVRYQDAGTDDLGEVDSRDDSLLIVLGGPMGVYQARQHPFLVQELALIRRRIDAGKPVLGICLGAQLLAHALGARVYSGPVKEIGFAPVRLTPAGRASALAPIGPDQPVLHWHGDTFDLPGGATLLASTDAYSNQAFAAGANLLGLQFHLEAGAEIDRWLTGHAEELAAAGVAPEGLRSDAARHASSLEEVSRDVLTRWLGALCD